MTAEVDKIARRIVADNQQARTRQSAAFRDLTEQLIDEEQQVNVDSILARLSGDAPDEEQRPDVATEVG